MAKQKKLKASVNFELDPKPFQKSLERVQDGLKTTGRKFEDFQDQVKQGHRQFEDLQDILKNTTRSFEDFANVIARADNPLGTQAKQLQELAKAAKDAQGDLANFATVLETIEIGKIASDLDEAKKAIESYTKALKPNVESLKDQDKYVKQVTESTKKLITQTKAEKDATTKSTTAIKTKKDLLEKLNQSLTNSIKNLKSFSTDISDNKSTLDTGAQSLQTYADSITSIGTTATQAQSKYSAFIDYIKDSKTPITNTADAFATLGGAVTSFSQRANNAIEKLDDLEIYLGTAKSAADQFTSSLGDASSELTFLGDSSREAITDLQKFSGEMSSLDTITSTTTASLIELGNQLKQIGSSGGTLDKQKETLDEYTKSSDRAAKSTKNLGDSTKRLAKDTNQSAKDIGTAKRKMMNDDDLLAQKSTAATDAVTRNTRRIGDEWKATGYDIGAYSKKSSSEFEMAGAKSKVVGTQMVADARVLASQYRASRQQMKSADKDLISTMRELAETSSSVTKSMMSDAKSSGGRGGMGGGYGGYSGGYIAALRDSGVVPNPQDLPRPPQTPHSIDHPISPYELKQPPSSPALKGPDPRLGGIYTAFPYGTILPPDGLYMQAAADDAIRAGIKMPMEEFKPRAFLSAVGGGEDPKRIKKPSDYLNREIRSHQMDKFVKDKREDLLFHEIYKSKGIFYQEGQEMGDDEVAAYNWFQHLRSKARTPEMEAESKRRAKEILDALNVPIQEDMLQRKALDRLADKYRKLNTSAMSDTVDSAKKRNDIIDFLKSHGGEDLAKRLEEESNETPKPPKIDPDEWKKQDDKIKKDKEAFEDSLHKHLSPIDKRIADFELQDYSTDVLQKRIDDTKEDLGHQRKELQHLEEKYGKTKSKAQQKMIDDIKETIQNEELDILAGERVLKDRKAGKHKAPKDARITDYERLHELEAIQYEKLLDADPEKDKQYIANVKSDLEETRRQKQAKAKELTKQEIKDIERDAAPNIREIYRSMKADDASDNMDIVKKTLDAADKEVKRKMTEDAKQEILKHGIDSVRETVERNAKKQNWSDELKRERLDILDEANKELLPTLPKPIEDALKNNTLNDFKRRMGIDPDKDVYEGLYDLDLDDDEYEKAIRSLPLPKDIEEAVRKSQQDKLAGKSAKEIKEEMASAARWGKEYYGKMSDKELEEFIDFQKKEIGYNFDGEAHNDAVSALTNAQAEQARRKNIGILKNVTDTHALPEPSKPPKKSDLSKAEKNLISRKLREALGVTEDTNLSDEIWSKTPQYEALKKELPNRKKYIENAIKDYVRTGMSEEDIDAEVADLNRMFDRIKDIETKKTKGNELAIDGITPEEFDRQHAKSLKAIKDDTKGFPPKPDTFPEDVERIKKMNERQLEELRREVVQDFETGDLFNPDDYNRVANEIAQRKLMKGVDPTESWTPAQRKQHEKNKTEIDKTLQELTDSSEQKRLKDATHPGLEYEKAKHQIEYAKKLAEWESTKNAASRKDLEDDMQEDMAAINAIDKMIKAKETKGIEYGPGDPKADAKEIMDNLDDATKNKIKEADTIGAGMSEIFGKGKEPDIDDPKVRQLIKAHKLTAENEEKIKKVMDFWTNDPDAPESNKTWKRAMKEKAKQLKKVTDSELNEMIDFEKKYLAHGHADMDTADSIVALGGALEERKRREKNYENAINKAHKLNFPTGKRPKDIIPEIDDAERNRKLKEAEDNLKKRQEREERENATLNFLNSIGQGDGVAKDILDKNKRDEEEPDTKYKNMMDEITDKINPTTLTHTRREADEIKEIMQDPKGPYRKKIEEDAFRFVSANAKADFKDLSLNQLEKAKKAKLAKFLQTRQFNSPADKTVLNWELAQIEQLISAEKRKKAEGKPLKPDVKDPFFTSTPFLNLDRDSKLFDKLRDEPGARGFLEDFMPEDRDTARQRRIEINRKDNEWMDDDLLAKDLKRLQTGAKQASGEELERYEDLIQANLQEQQRRKKDYEDAINKAHKLNFPLGKRAKDIIDKDNKLFWESDDVKNKKAFEDLIERQDLTPEKIMKKSLPELMSGLAHPKDIEKMRLEITEKMGGDLDKLKEYEKMWRKRTIENRDPDKLAFLENMVLAATNATDARQSELFDEQAQKRIDSGEFKDLKDVQAKLKKARAKNFEIADKIKSAKSDKTKSQYTAQQTALIPEIIDLEHAERLFTEKLDRKDRHKEAVRKAKEHYTHDFPNWEVGGPEWEERKKTWETSKKIFGPDATPDIDDDDEEGRTRAGYDQARAHIEAMESIEKQHPEGMKKQKERQEKHRQSLIDLVESYDAKMRKRITGPERQYHNTEYGEMIDKVDIKDMPFVKEQFQKKRKTLLAEEYKKFSDTELRQESERVTPDSKSHPNPLVRKDAQDMLGAIRAEHKQRLAKDQEIKIDVKIEGESKAVKAIKDIGKSSKTAEKEIKRMEKAFRNSMKKFDTLGKTSNRLNKNLKDLGKTGNKTGKDITDMGKSACGHASKRFDNLAKSAQNLGKKLKEAAKESVATMKNIIGMGKSGDKSAKHIKDLAKETEDLGKEAGQASKKTKQAADGIDDMGDSSRRAKKDIGDVGDKLDSVQQGSLQASQTIGEFAGSITGISDRIFGFNERVVALERSKFGLKQTTLDLKIEEREYADAVASGAYSAQELADMEERLKLSREDLKIETEELAAETLALQGEYVTMGVETGNAVLQAIQMSKNLGTIKQDFSGLGDSLRGIGGKLSGFGSKIKGIGKSLPSVTKNLKGTTLGMKALGATPILIGLSAIVLLWQAWETNAWGFRDAIKSTVEWFENGWRWLQKLVLKFKPFRDLMLDVKVFLGQMTQAQADAIKKSDDWDKKVDEMVDGQERLSDSIDTTTDSTDDLTESTDELSSGQEDLGETIGTVTKELKDMNGELIQTYTNMSDLIEAGVTVGSTYDDVWTKFDSGMPKVDDPLSDVHSSIDAMWTKLNDDDFWNRPKETLDLVIRNMTTAYASAEGNIGKIKSIVESNMGIIEDSINRLVEQEDIDELTKLKDAFALLWPAASESLTPIVDQALASLGGAVDDVTTKVGLLNSAFAGLTIPEIQAGMADGSLPRYFGGFQSFGNIPPGMISQSEYSVHNPLSPYSNQQGPSQAQIEAAYATGGSGAVMQLFKGQRYLNPKMGTDPEDLAQYTYDEHGNPNNPYLPTTYFFDTKGYEEAMAFLNPPQVMSDQQYASEMAIPYHSGFHQQAPNLLGHTPYYYFDPAHMDAIVDGPMFKSVANTNASHFGRYDVMDDLNLWDIATSIYDEPGKNPTDVRGEDLVKTIVNLFDKIKNSRGNFMLRGAYGMESDITDRERELLSQIIYRFGVNPDNDYRLNSSGIIHTGNAWMDANEKNFILEAFANAGIGDWQHAVDNAPEPSGTRRDSTGTYLELLGVEYGASVSGTSPGTSRSTIQGISLTDEGLENVHYNKNKGWYVKTTNDYGEPEYQYFGGGKTGMAQAIEHATGKPLTDKSDDTDTQEDQTESLEHIDETTAYGFTNLTDLTTKTNEELQWLLDRNDTLNELVANTVLELEDMNKRGEDTTEILQYLSDIGAEQQTVGGLISQITPDQIKEIFGYVAPLINQDIQDSRIIQQIIGDIGKGGYEWQNLARAGMADILRGDYLTEGEVGEAKNRAIALFDKAKTDNAELQELAEKEIELVRKYNKEEDEATRKSLETQIEANRDRQDELRESIDLAQEEYDAILSLVQGGILTNDELHAIQEHEQEIERNSWETNLALERVIKEEEDLQQKIAEMEEADKDRTFKLHGEDIEKYNGMLTELGRIRKGLEGKLAGYEEELETIRIPFQGLAGYGMTEQERQDRLTELKGTRDSLMEDKIANFQEIKDIDREIQQLNAVSFISKLWPEKTHEEINDSLADIPEELQELEKILNQYSPKWYDSFADDDLRHDNQTWQTVNDAITRYDDILAHLGTLGIDYQSGLNQKWWEHTDFDEKASLPSHLRPGTDEFRIHEINTKITGLLDTIEAMEYFGEDVTTEEGILDYLYDQRDDLLEELGDGFEEVNNLITPKTSDTEEKLLEEIQDINKDGGYLSSIAGFAGEDGILKQIHDKIWDGKNFGELITNPIVSALRGVEIKPTIVINADGSQTSPPDDPNRGSQI